jgi:hypothetical protein
VSHSNIDNSDGCGAGLVLMEVSSAGAARFQHNCAAHHARSCRQSRPEVSKPSGPLLFLPKPQAVTGTQSSTKTTNGMGRSLRLTEQVVNGGAILVFLKQTQKA